MVYSKIQTHLYISIQFYSSAVKFSFNRTICRRDCVRQFGWFNIWKLYFNSNNFDGNISNNFEYNFSYLYLQQIVLDNYIDSRLPHSALLWFHPHVVTLNISMHWKVVGPTLLLRYFCSSCYHLEAYEWHFHEYVFQCKNKDWVYKIFYVITYLNTSKVSNLYHIIVTFFQVQSHLWYWHGSCN